MTAVKTRTAGEGRRAGTARAYRYEETARFITDLVDSGTLIPGARVPSLREITRQRRISLSTALQAYRALEDRGVLQARPQSGFYVAKRAPILSQTPAITNPPGKPTTVAVSGVVPKFLEYAGDPNLLPLGCAIPDAELLAAGRLDRFLARAARAKGVDYNKYTAPKGDPRLRREIARRALRWGQVLSPEDIVITCGCTEALVLALRWSHARATRSPSSRRRTSASCRSSRLSISERSSCRPMRAAASISRPSDERSRPHRSRPVFSRRASTTPWAAPCRTRGRRPSSSCSPSNGSR